MEDKKVWALLEIHHDSDKGPNDVDFEHNVTLHNSEKDARKALVEARNRVLKSPICSRNEIVENRGNMIVLASDDWWKWEIMKVEAPSEVPHGKRTFTVRHRWTVQKDYEIEANSKEEALRKLRTKINSGEVSVWTDGYEATDKEMAWVPGDGEVAE